jgi:hypothetical protein
MLLQQKSLELNGLSEQLKQLTRRLSQNTTTPPVESRPCFGTIFEAEKGKKYSQALTNSKQSIEIVASWRRFKQLNMHFETQLQNALKKDVALSIVTEKPPNHHLPKWIKQALLRYPKFNLKIMQTMPPAAITVFDQHTVALAFSPNSSLLKGPDMWTTTPTLKTLGQAYFNAIWAQNKNYRCRQNSTNF